MISKSWKFQTQEMIKEIIQAFVKRIEKHKWIDEKTKKGILEKVAFSSITLPFSRSMLP